MLALGHDVAALLAVVRQNQRGGVVTHRDGLRD
jgi:hypothetical protein